MHALTGGNDESDPRQRRNSRRRNTYDLSKSMDMTKFKTGAMMQDMVCGV